MLLPPWLLTPPELVRLGMPPGVIVCPQQQPLSDGVGAAGGLRQHVRQCLVRLLGLPSQGKGLNEGIVRHDVWGQSMGLHPPEETRDLRRQALLRKGSHENVERLDQTRTARSKHTRLSNGKQSASSRQPTTGPAAGSLGRQLQGATARPPLLSYPLS